MTNCKLFRSLGNLQWQFLHPGTLSSWKAETLQEFIRVKLYQTILFKSGLLALKQHPSPGLSRRNITWCGDGKEKSRVSGGWPYKN